MNKSETSHSGADPSKSRQSTQTATQVPCIQALVFGVARTSGFRRM